MPEGPEIKIVAQNISKIIGKKLVSLNDKKIEETVQLVNTRGKFLYIKLERGYIGINFGMTGELDFSPKEKYVRDILQFSDCVLYFYDPRNFGEVRYYNEEELQNKLNKLGVDIFSITPEIVEIFLNRYRKSLLAIALMKQDIISGIGNYLRAEIIYEAKIPPHSKCGEVSAEKLFNAIVTVRDEIMRCSGTSYFYNSKYKFRVYRQKRDPTGRPVHKKLVGGRSLYYI